jgi:hypothetical protein
MKPGSAEIDRRVLLAERDAARRERLVRDLREEIAALELKLKRAELKNKEHRHDLAQLETHLRRLYETPSWRWSAPLRRATNLWQRFAAALGGPPPDRPDGPPPVKTEEPAPDMPLSIREQAIFRRLRAPG